MVVTGTERAVALRQAGSNGEAVPAAVGAMEMSAAWPAAAVVAHPATSPGWRARPRDLWASLLPQLFPTKAASYPVSVRRLATLLHASFRQSLAVLPLRYASASPPSGWIGDLHPQNCRTCPTHRTLHAGLAYAAASKAGREKTAICPPRTT